MSRLTLLLIGSALMLIVAACDANGDDNGIDDTTDDTTELPTEDEEPGDSDVVVPEGEDDAVGSEPEDDDPLATEPSDDDPVTQDDQAVEPGDDEMVDPEDEEAMDPDSMQPGPEEGYFFDLTFEEANDLTAFNLKEPAEIPEGVEFQTIMAMASPEATEEERGEQATTVTFSYTQTPDEEMMQGLPVELTQTTEVDMSEGLPPEAEQEQITVGEREVTRVVIAAETGDEILAYMWDEGDVYFSLAAILGEDLEESELENMLASIPTS